MADAELDAARRVIANLAGPFEDAAHNPEGQSVETLDGGGRQFRGLVTLERHLQ